MRVDNSWILVFKDTSLSARFFLAGLGCCMSRLG
jgi:hypothetical protein